ncbi:hypothetical protein LXL04_010150 [Taraxacum kok-saghyz]
MPSINKTLHFHRPTFLLPCVQNRCFIPFKTAIDTSSPTSTFDLRPDLRPAAAHLVPHRGCSLLVIGHSDIQNTQRQTSPKSTTAQPQASFLWRQMASSLRRIGSQSSTAHRFVVPQLISRFSTDALSVEYKAGEIGTVSGIPDEHLQRRVGPVYHSVTFR